MVITVRLKMLAGLAAAAFCLVCISANEASAQIVRQGAATYRYYNYYNGRSTIGNYGIRGRGYSGYGRGPYQSRSSGVYVSPRSSTYRHGTYYRGGLNLRRQAYGGTYYYRSGARYYSPYGYQWGF